MVTPDHFHCSAGCEKAAGVLPPGWKIDSWDTGTYVTHPLEPHPLWGNLWGPYLIWAEAAADIPWVCCRCGAPFVACTPEICG